MLPTCLTHNTVPRADSATNWCPVRNFDKIRVSWHHPIAETCWNGSALRPSSWFWRTSHFKVPRAMKYHQTKPFGRRLQTHSSEYMRLEQSFYIIWLSSRPGAPHAGRPLRCFFKELGNLCWICYIASHPHNSNHPLEKENTNINTYKKQEKPCCGLILSGQDCCWGSVFFLHLFTIYESEH